MGRSVNFDAVPDTGVVPDGVYHVFIAEFEEKQSGKGKLMYAPRLEIMEPEDFANMSIYDNFTIGDDTDPDAAEDATWIKSVGARRMKQMLKAAQVPLDNDMDNVIAAAIQQQLVVSVNQEVDDGERDPQYKGRVRNRISSFYQLGHKEVGLTDAPAPKKPLAAVPKAAAPAAAKAPAPAARAPAPAQRPLSATGGATLSKPAAAPARPAAPKPAAKAAEVKCTICDTMVVRSDFAAHVEAHADES